MSKTDLIDRYLNAVKFWLPGKQQKDILAELAEDLHSQIEDRELALGHPLEETGIVDILRRRGSPMRVASGFIPEQRLINPALLPIYRLVLKIVMLWVLLPLFAIVFIAPVFDSARPGEALLRFFIESWRAAFFVIGIVTTVFALLDRYHTKWVDKWDPRKLPRVPAPHQQMEWYNDFAGFAAGMGAFVFWGGMMWHRSVFEFAGGFRIVLAAAWGQIYWTVLVLTLVRALLDLYCFVRRAWTPARSWMRLAMDVANMVVALLLLRVSSWIEIAGPSVKPADAAKVMSWVNSSMQITLICIVGITLFDVVKQLRLLYRKNGHTAPILMVS